jgi:hypothetical protein
VTALSVQKATQSMGHDDAVRCAKSLCNLKDSFA